MSNFLFKRYQTIYLRLLKWITNPPNYTTDPDFDKAGGVDGNIGVGLFYELLGEVQIVPTNYPGAY